MKIVHYVNQFFAGIGGEDSAGTGPELRDGAWDPGGSLATLLGDEHEIIATAICGDDYAASHPEFAAELVRRPASAAPRCRGRSRLHQRALRHGVRADRGGGQRGGTARAGLDASREPRPGRGRRHGGRRERPDLAPHAATRSTASRRRRCKVAAGEELTAQDGRIGPVARTNRLAQRSAAERAVALVLTRLGGDRDATEIPLPDFDRVTPAAPIADPAEALFALVTEGGFVPAGNPDRLESARATKWVRHSLDGLDSADERQLRVGARRVLHRSGPTPIPTASSRSTSPASWSARERSDACTASTSGRPATAPRSPTRAASGWSGPPSCAKRTSRRHPHRHLRNRHALRVNADEGAGARRDPHRAAVQPRLDRAARRRAAHRAHARHPVPDRRPGARVRGGARLAPAAARTGAPRGRHPGHASRRSSTAIRFNRSHMPYR